MPVDRRAWETIALLKQLRAEPQLLGMLSEPSQDRQEELALQQHLRREYPAPLVRAALTQVELRKRAAARFTRADRMWLERQRLEQATSEPVARYKAGRFSGTIRDWCCGLGADTLALAERGTILAVDCDPLACLLTLWNAEVYEVAERVQVVCADVTQLTDRRGLLHIDPDRRTRRGRSVRIADCVPGPDMLLAVMDEFRGGAIKLSPASDFGRWFADRDVEIELISLNGECKEATVWFGELRGVEPFRATALPSGESIGGHPLDVEARIGPPGRFLVDPDPAVVRAGMVDRLAERFGLWRLDAEEEYLSSDAPPETALARSFEIEAVLPNNTRTIRQYFRDHPAGAVEIRCRHIPLDVEAIRRRLPLRGRDRAVLFFARVGNRARAVVCRPHA